MLNIKKPKSNDQNNTKNTKNIKLPWVPILGRKLRKEFKKKDIKTVFTSGTDLKSILCQSKSKLLPNSYLGVYALNCSCNAEYIGETKKSDDQNNGTPTKQHKGKMGKLRCDGRLFKMSWSIQLSTSKAERYKCRKIRESLEIKISKFDSSKSNINRDDGNLVKTNTWAHLLRKINDLESAVRNQRSHCKADMTSY